MDGYTLGEVTETVEYGLLTPSGAVVWPPEDYRGYPLNTAEERARICEILRVGGAEMLLDPEQFAGGFSWVSRRRTMTVVYGMSTETLAIDHDWPAERTNSTPND